MPERFECTTLAKKRYINTLPFHCFPFLKTLLLADPLIASNQAFWIGLCVHHNSSGINAHAEYTDVTDRHTNRSQRKNSRQVHTQHANVVGDGTNKMMSAKRIYGPAYTSCLKKTSHLYNLL